MKMDNIEKICAEIAEYEKRTGKHISYGKYVAMMQADNKGSVHNAKNKKPHKGGRCQVRLDEDDIFNILEKFESGESIENIASEFSVTDATIQKHLEMNGLIQITPRQMKWTDERIKMLRNLYLAGNPIKKIARLLSSTEPAVKNMIHRLGLAEEKRRLNSGK